MEVADMNVDPIPRRFSKKTGMSADGVRHSF